MSKDFAVHDFKSYRAAKTLVGHLKELIKRIDRCTNDLKPYGAFVQTRNILWEMKRSKTALEAHLRRCEGIVARKGAKEEADEKEK